MAQSVRFVPVSIFGAVMGIAGLALASRNAHAVLGVPAWIAEIWAVLTLIGLAGLLIVYAMKGLQHRDAVAAEWRNAGQLAFFGTIPIALALGAGCIGPYAASVAKALWWMAVALCFALQAFALGRWLRGGIELAHVNTGWMIMMIGPIPMATGGLAIGELASARVLFGIGLVATPFFMGLAVQRTILGAPLPDAMKPITFILLVPAALAYALIPALWDLPSTFVLETLYYFDLVLFAGLVVMARNIAAWPFTPAWWGLTFPLDALAAAALAYAKFHPTALPTALAWAAWLIALAAVTIVLVRSALSLARGTLFAPPKPA